MVYLTRSGLWGGRSVLKHLLNKVETRPRGEACVDLKGLGTVVCLKPDEMQAWLKGDSQLNSASSEAVKFVVMG